MARSNSNIRGAGGLPSGMVNVLSPALSGEPDVIAQRAATLAVPGMFADQAKKDGLVPDKNVDHTLLSPSFVVAPTTGVHPLAVQFTATTSGKPDVYDWDFGDGSPHGTTQNPAHTYATAGTFAIKLTVSRTGTLGGEPQSLEVATGSIVVT
jgi:PKD repeat protein